MTRNFVGYVETLARHEVRGWVIDAATPQTRLAVDLVVDGWVVATAAADWSRDDLATLGYGRVDFGFQLAVPTGVTVDLARVGVRVAQSETMLPVAQGASSIEGVVEIVEPGRICGWAWRVGFPGERVKLSVQANGAEVKQANADVFRPDLLDAEIGDGQHGFAINFAGDQIDVLNTPLVVLAGTEATPLTDMRAGALAPPSRAAGPGTPRVSIEPPPSSIRLSAEAVEAMNLAIDLNDDGRSTL